MLFNFGYQSVILLIFFTQGIVFSFLLLKKGITQENASDQWLSLFVFLCALYIVPWMCGHAGWYASDGYREFLFFVPFHQLYLIGPVIYFYTQSLLNKDFRFTRKDLLHLLPAAGYLIYAVIIAITDLLILDEYYFYADGRDKDLAPWYQISGLISMIGYAGLSLRYYHQYRTRIYDTVSFADTIKIKWLQQFLAVYLLVLVVRISFHILFPNWGDFGSKWWYYLIFAVLAYYLAITGYSNTIRATIQLEPEGVAPIEPVATPAQAPTKSDGKEQIDLESWTERVQNAIATRELYKDPKLTLHQLAGDLNASPNLLSRIINTGFGLNFNDFINRYRVEAVKRAIEQKQHEQLTLLAIALACGFNSKTTFNRAFKKYTGITPAQYLKTLKP